MRNIYLQFVCKIYPLYRFRYYNISIHERCGAPMRLLQNFHTRILIRIQAFDSLKTFTSHWCAVLFHI